MLDETAINEAMLQASLLQHQSQQGHSMDPGIEDMSYDDSVMNLHNTILLQQALQSSTNSPTTNILALDTPNMLAFQDSSAQLWSASGLMPHLSLATEQLAELQLAQASTTTSSPVVPSDEFMLRRASTTSLQDLTEWQDKARTEVCDSDFENALLIPGSEERCRIALRNGHIESAKRKLSPR